MQNINKDNNQFSEQTLIRGFLNDSLNKEQELEIARLYDQDEDFKDALDGFEGLSVEEYDKLMNKINESIDNKTLSPTATQQHLGSNDNTVELNPYRRMAIAASIVLFLLAGCYITFSKMKSPTTKMFANNFEIKEYPDLITRGSGEELSTSEKLAISAYNLENYEVSIEHFEMLKSKYPENVKYGLFLGISYLCAQKPELAIETLKNTKYEGTSFCNDVNWYLGLAYLKVKDKKMAKEVFTKLAVEDCYYKDAALEILKKL